MNIMTAWPRSAHNVDVFYAGYDVNGLGKEVWSEATCVPMTLTEAKQHAREGSLSCCYAELNYGDRHYTFKAGKEER